MLLSISASMRVPGVTRKAPWRAAENPGKRRIHAHAQPPVRTAESVSNACGLPRSAISPRSGVFFSTLTTGTGESHPLWESSREKKKGPGFRFHTVRKAAFPTVALPIASAPRYRNQPSASFFSSFESFPFSFGGAACGACCGVFSPVTKLLDTRTRTPGAISRVITDSVRPVIFP